MSKVKLFSVSIHDCRVETIAATKGGGGQRKNAKQTAVRITHEPSGAVGFSADEREQGRNKRVAFLRMANNPIFKAWCRARAAQLSSGKSIDEQVDEMMAPENIKVEVKKDGKWTPLEAPQERRA